MSNENESIILAEYPDVHVYNETNPTSVQGGMSGRVAIIGAFDTLETAPKSYIKQKDAIADLGDDTAYNGCRVLPYIMNGASSVLCVNYTSETGTGENITRDKELTPDKLRNCLAKIKHEQFDILFIAEPLTDELIVLITGFLDSIYEIKNPACYTGCINRNNSNGYLNTLKLAGEYCIALISQSFGLKSKNADVNLLESIAYLTGFIASLPVGTSLTKKIIPDIKSVNPIYTFEEGDDGLNYMQHGMAVFECINSLTDDYVWVNSQQPKGLDLYMVRSRNYIIREFALREFLGEYKKKTIDEIKQEVDRVKNYIINDLELVNDIVYRVERTEASCVDIWIDRMVFAGVITSINLHIRVEVE